MRGVWRRLVELVRPGRLDRETIEELSHHVDLMVERKIAAGADARDARRQALAEVGSIAAARERVAADRTGVALDQLGREIRYAARVLARSPGVTLLSIATMGLGIGASAILFALVNGIVLQPLPYPEPDRLVRIFDRNTTAGIERAGVASGNIDDWRRRTAAFEGVAGYFAMGRTVSFEAEAGVLIGAQVSDDFFQLLRVAPLLGRAFTEEEFRRADFNSAAAPIGPDPVVLLSHAVWTERFGRDPDIVGRTIALERRPFTVVGVMPARFAMPDASVQLWIPWNISADRPRDQHYLGAVARVKAGVTIAQAEDMLTAVARDLGDEFPDTNRGWTVQLSPLAAETLGDTASVLWILLAAVGLVLLVACANVALLSLMRGLDRRHEAAVRLALGATPARLFREFLLESTLLATLGGAAGAAIAVAGLRLLPALTSHLPRLDEVAFDLRALAFVVVVTSLAAVVSGPPQAWRRMRVPPSAGLAAASVRVSEPVDRHWFRGAIVVAEVAMALVLMMGSALVVRSFLQLRASEPGFDPRGVLVAPVFLDSQHYNSGERSRTYYRTLFEKLAALPGVMAVGGATTVPTSPLGPDFDRPVWPQGDRSDAASRTPASVRMITPGYVEAMGLRLIAGRAFDDRDSPLAPRVLMVSETLATRFWPGQSAVGKQLMVDYSTAGTYPSEIVGVLGDVRFRGPRSAPLAEIYAPHAQRPYLIMNVVVKAAGDPRALVGPVRAALKEVDPLKPAHGLYPLEDLVGATYARDRQVMVALLMFAAAAIVLALLSVYGVLSQRVRERSRDIGIRIAMGAGTPNVVGWVVGSGLRLIALGLGVGALGSRALAGALDGLLFGVAATDVPTLAAVMAMLALVGAVATLVPSWRATRIDPVQILRRG
jgi:putative ABC transport system permease protein